MMNTNDTRKLAEMVLQTVHAATQALEVAKDNPAVWELIKSEYNQALLNFEKAATSAGKLDKE